MAVVESGRVGELQLWVQTSWRLMCRLPRVPPLTYHSCRIHGRLQVKQNNFSAKPYCLSHIAASYLAASY